GAISPRPCLVYSAKRDRQVDSNEVRACLGRANSPTLTFVHSDDVNRFQASQHAILLEWLQSLP
ncbi:MAG: hypothetical protein GWO24_29630, partial [Akkermansiaceae bacterium]|nr:hypothetical protein [Akkermansiaceae bacterium]